MSDKILQALMQLFAIVATAERFSATGRNFVESFLKQQISQANVPNYLSVFEKYRSFLQGKSESGKTKKRVSVNSVKILKICTDINKELEQKQKYVVLVRLIEFVFASEGEVTQQELDFIETVAEVFHISKEEYNACRLLVSKKEDESIQDNSEFLVINAKPALTGSTRHIFHESLTGKFWVLIIRSANLLFVKYSGDSSMHLNGQPMLAGKAFVLSTGSVIRGSKVLPVYYSDIMRSFLLDDQTGDLIFQAADIDFKFRNGNYGLHRTNFTANSGDLIGIMGGSGAGKSTLLNILNSNYKPESGRVLINGIDLHNAGHKLEGVIGHVPQDDLLMEDLTVFQNLYYNSKLCFGDLSDGEISSMVDEQLEVLGLFQARDLKVGSSLDKTISGGQRKRLNIALELIRKPMILFVDEPTSGLSSLDSENVMDLLKQLSLSGKLVFVVIHQPSSSIYRLFDRLLILDIGGYPIYYGNPADALIYFKRRSDYVDADISECPACGNVNAEQIFSIIESRVMDEFGHPTADRKISPSEWYEHFEQSGLNTGIEVNDEESTVRSSFQKPSRLRQMSVFIIRDILSKLKNTQYLMINFTEAPLLALILAFVLKYYNSGSGYIFSENQNLPAFIFVSVLVAIFMGLTVSAEEIIRDRKILKREAFLNLSHSSYLISKMSVQFLISAIQTFSYVLVANLVFEIQDMMFQYWLILFSVSCFSNVAGLNISSAFTSVVTIYILIPFLIIPQIILSGVMVKFDDLNPKVTDQARVPLVGELMTARWAFEALAVEQFKGNRYERNFFEVNKEMSNATYKKDFWLIKVQDAINRTIKSEKNKSGGDDLKLLQNELKKEVRLNKEVKCSIDFKQPLSVDLVKSKALRDYVTALKAYYVKLYNRSNKTKDRIVDDLKTKVGGSEALADLKNDHTNKSLEDVVLNVNNFDVIIEHNNKLIQRFRPIYMDGSQNSFVRAPLYVSRKHAFGQYFSTFRVNCIVIWVLSLLLMLTLYFDIPGKSIKMMNSLSNKFLAELRR